MKGGKDRPVNMPKRGGPTSGTHTSSAKPPVGSAAPTKPIGPERYSPLWTGAKKKNTAASIQPTPLITMALERFKLCAEATGVMRAAALDDWRFRTGEQWPAEIVAQRDIQKRPCLTVNRIPAFTRQVCNEQRQQRPSLTVNPVGDGADVELAEVQQGLIRHVEINSHADVAYDTAFEQMLVGGFGYWRLRTAYVSDDGFAQDVFIEWIQNPFSVYLDPAAQKPDKSDARYGFITYDVPIGEYPTQYPNSALAARLRQAKSGENLTTTGDVPPDWCDSKFVRVAEYFHVEEEDGGTIYLLESGEVVSELADGETPVQTRRLKNRVVKWNLINGCESLEESDWVGETVPIYEVVGDDFIVDGKRYLAGMVRDAKDPQRMSNYWKTAATELQALAPRAPYIGTPHNFEQYQTMWQQANNSPSMYLTYDPDPANGGGPPQRQQFEPPIQGMAQMLALAENDLKAVTGIFDAAMGAPGPEQSAKAVLARQAQTINGNANWADNLARTMRRCGRDLLKIFPKIYSDGAVRRIVKPDGTAEMVGIHASDAGDPPPVIPGARKVYNIGIGTYDVTVTVGPSFQSRRQEASASMLELVKVAPQIFPLIGDLMVANMDWPHAQEIAKRLKTLLPPQLQDGDPADPMVQLAQKNQQLQQLIAQHQQLAALAQQQAQTIQQETVQANAKIRIAEIQAQATVTAAEITTKFQELKTRMEFEQAQWQSMHDAAHELAMRESAPAPVVAAPGAATAPTS